VLREQRRRDRNSLIKKYKYDDKFVYNNESSNGKTTKQNTKRINKNLNSRAKELKSKN